MAEKRMTFDIRDSIVGGKIPRPRPWLKRWWMVGMDTAADGRGLTFCVVERRFGIWSPLWKLPARVQRWLGGDRCAIYLTMEDR